MTIVQGDSAVPILMKCACGKQMRAADEHAGKKVKCPGCGNAVTVPQSHES